MEDDAMNRWWWLVCAGAGLCWACAGCVSVKAPREINVGSSGKPAHVDSGHVPATSSHEDCRQELDKAYQNIRYLERKVGDLERKVKKCEREKEVREDDLERCKDRLERYED